MGLLLMQYCFRSFSVGVGSNHLIVFYTVYVFTSLIATMDKVPSALPLEEIECVLS